MDLISINKENKLFNYDSIPKDWEIKKIGDIFGDLRTGSTPSRSNKSYFKGNIPWITSGELKYKTIYDTKEKITEEAVKDTNLKIYPKETFYIAITGLEAEGTRGSCAISGIEATTNQSCLAFQPKKNFSNKYLFYWYRMHGNNIAFRYAQGTKQQSLNNKIVQEIQIPVPPFKEQQKIADILTTIDELIDNLEGSINKFVTLKRALMHRLITQGIEHTVFKSTAIGDIPSSWEVKKLGDIFGDLRTGSTPRRNVKSYYTGNIPWITSGELKYKTIYETNEKITEEAVKDTNLKIYPIGTFFIAITGLEAAGTRGSCALSGIEATTNQSCLAFQPKEGFSNRYLYHWYRLNGNNIAFKYAQGTKQQSLNNKIIQEIKIPVPPLEEQEKISNILFSLDDQITELENRVKSYKGLQKSLMQSLLHGKIRVKV